MRTTHDQQWFVEKNVAQKRIFKKKLDYIFQYIEIPDNIFQNTEIHNLIFLSLVSIPKVCPLLRKTPSCAQEFMAISEDSNAQWNADTLENQDWRGRDRLSFDLLRVTFLED